MKPMPAHAAAPPATFDTLVKPFLAENCYECHGNKKQKKEINFETIDSVAALADDPDVWEEVVRRLRGREMPPEEEPQPAEHARQAVAGWIDRELKRIDRTTPPDPGRVTTRRLNRTEYNNTIGELLGVNMRPADDFPQDDSGYGFDNIADVLSLSPGLMEKYISAADKVAHTALFGPADAQADPAAAAIRRAPRQGGEDAIPATTTSRASACRTRFMPSTVSPWTANTSSRSRSPASGPRDPRRSRLRSGSTSAR